MDFDLKIFMLKQSILDSFNDAQMPITLVDLILGEMKTESAKEVTKAIAIQKEHYNKEQERIAKEQNKDTPIVP